MTRPFLSMIAAVTRNGAIGKNNELLWHEPEDQRRFRRVTMGCPVVMGRKTWDSLPARFRPLPGRRNLVITRNPSWVDRGAEAFASVADALAAVTDAPKVFVIGGAELYAGALALADELMLTEIDIELIGNTYFPPWDRNKFTLTSRESHVSPSGVSYSFTTYQKNEGD